MKGAFLFDPTDHDLIYINQGDYEALTFGMAKYSWVPNGNSERDTDWGETWSADFDESGGVYSDGDYIYTCTQNAWIAEPMSHMYIVDFEDGSLVQDQMLEDWWIRPDDYFRDDGANYLNCGPVWLEMKQNKLFMGFWYCMFMMTDPVRYLDSGYDYEELVVWVNQNGDYVNDRGWDPDNETPWLCFAEGGPHINTFYADNNLFSTAGQYDMGAVSFSLLGPDGTAIGIFTLAGETAGFKRGGMFVSTGSAYDGMYTDNSSAEENTAGYWFIGHDSLKGVITSKVAVTDNGPAEFSVDQNSPNPFNPTTTIGFNLSKANTVSVDIYNVAGQVIDTVLNDFLDAGSHSVVWDASSFGAGVYFYTVKSGDYSETVKMTLLK